MLQLVIVYHLYGGIGGVVRYHMSTLRKGHVFSSPCRMSISSMSHVEFKKGPCNSVDFRVPCAFFYLNVTNIVYWPLLKYSSLISKL